MSAGHGGSDFSPPSEDEELESPVAASAVSETDEDGASAVAVDEADVAEADDDERSDVAEADDDERRDVADVAEADVAEADVAEADVAEADVDEADEAEADEAEADEAEADEAEADVDEADVDEADVDEADVDEADVDEADVDEADDDQLDVAEADDDDQRDDDHEALGEEIGLDLDTPAKTRSSTGPAPQAAPTGGLGPGAATERFGHQVRHYRMGVSGAALALAWARQENAPDGATVVVEREVSPLGRLGRMWTTPPESTLSCAIVIRPPLSVEEADATWLLAGVATAEGAEAASGRKLATWWPDSVVDAETSEAVAHLKVEIQLGPGKVRSAVASIRIDLDKLGVGPEGRDAVLEQILGALDRNSESLSEGSTGVAAAYDGRCGMLGQRVKLRLLPKGETRGVARRVDRMARLELESATGMVQKVGIDNLRELTAVGPKDAAAD